MRKTSIAALFHRTAKRTAEKRETHNLRIFTLYQTGQKAEALSREEAGYRLLRPGFFSPNR